MNGIRNNVIFCGFDEVDKNSFWLNDVREYLEVGVYFDDIAKRLKHRFPYVIYVDTLSDAIKHQGHAIFIKVDKSIKSKTKREIDLYYRSLLYKYDRIYLYNASFKEKDLNKFSNITFIGEDVLCGELDEFINQEYYYFIEKKSVLKKNTPKVLSNVNKIKEYMKYKKIATSEDISREFNMNIRSIQRYMKILNDLNNCIGCDYYNNEWYYISPKISV